MGILKFISVWQIVLKIKSGFSEIIVLPKIGKDSKTSTKILCFVYKTIPNFKRKHI